MYARTVRAMPMMDAADGCEANVGDADGRGNARASGRTAPHTCVTRRTDLTMSADTYVCVRARARARAIGPMVYGICYCPLARAEEMAAMGFAGARAASPLEPSAASD